MRNLQEYSQKFPNNKKKISKVLNDSKDLEKIKNFAIKDFVRLSSSIDERQSIFFYGGRPIRSCPADIVRVIAESSQSDSNHLIVRNIILNSIMSLETNSVFSGYAFFKYLRGERAAAYRQRSEFDEAIFLVKKHLGRGMCYDIVKSIADNRGIVKKLNFVLSDKKHEIVLTKKSEWALKGSVPEVFSECFFNANKIRKVDNSRILFVDGAIERISEIHHLLETSAPSDDYGIIVAQSFSPDVINTLLENFKSQKLNIVPFLYSHEDGIRDTFYKSGITTICTDAGEVLSSLSFDDLEKRKDCVFYRNELSILDLEVQKNNIHYTVEIPKHYHKMSGIIEDRVRSGLKFFYEISKYGIAFNEKDVPIFGLKQYKKAEEFAGHFLKTMENLGGLIVVE